MKQIGEAVVDGGGGDEQHPRADDEPREAAVAARLGIPEAVGFVDKKQRGRTEADGGGQGRTAETLVRHDRCLEVQPVEQPAPLVHEHAGNDKRERIAQHPGDRKRDVRLAESDSVGEHGTAVARDDGRQPFRRGALVRGEPGQRVTWNLWQVEQGARRARSHGGGRRRRFRAEQEGQRLGGGLEVLREDPGGRGRHGRAYGGRRHRGGGARRRGLRRSRPGRHPPRAAANRGMRPPARAAPARRGR